MVVYRVYQHCFVIPDRTGQPSYTHAFDHGRTQDASHDEKVAHGHSREHGEPLPAGEASVDQAIEERDEEEQREEVGRTEYGGR